MNAPSIADTLQTIGLQAKNASALMAKAPAAVKNAALRRLAALLRANVAALQVDNGRDLERATANGLSEPMVDRLKLTPKVLDTCAEGCEQLAAMPDVIGEIIGMKQQPSVLAYSLILIAFMPPPVNPAETNRARHPCPPTSPAWRRP